jgi:hypothetical protein
MVVLDSAPRATGEDKASMGVLLVVVVVSPGLVLLNVVFEVSLMGTLPTGEIVREDLWPWLLLPVLIVLVSANVPPVGMREILAGAGLARGLGKLSGSRFPPGRVGAPRVGIPVLQLSVPSHGEPSVSSQRWVCPEAEATASSELPAMKAIRVERREGEFMDEG